MSVCVGVFVCVREREREKASKLAYGSADRGYRTTTIHEVDDYLYASIYIPKKTRAKEHCKR